MSPPPASAESRVQKMIGSKPYATLKYREVNGARMAYVDEGDGDAIVFQHGQPASSYVWRNVMPHLEGLGRLVAADLVGMGASEKLTDAGPGSYSLAEHAKYLFALWDALDLSDQIVLVLDDWGAALGFWWARLNPERVKAIVHMEAVAVADELLRPSRGGACCLQGAPLAGRRGDGAQGEHLHRAGAEARDDPPPQPRRD
ncbi:MAG: alpha/beta fold hydrolase [Methylocella sp.]